MKNSGRLYIIQQETTNNKLVQEVAEAIRADLVSKGISTLNAGDVLLLKDVGYYVPRLRSPGVVEDDGEISEPLVEAGEDIVLPTEFVIEDKYLPSKRFGKIRKKGDIKAIVLHQTGGTTAEGAIETFKSEGSAHYLIDKDGTIMGLVPDLNIAAHVGTPTTWVTNANSIGIEYVGYFNEVEGQREVIYHDVTPQQQAAGKWLMLQLMRKHDITRENIFRHPQVSRKMRTEAQSIEIP